MLEAVLDPLCGGRGEKFNTNVNILKLLYI